MQIAHDLETLVKLMGTEGPAVERSLKEFVDFMVRLADLFDATRWYATESDTLRETKYRTTLTGE